MYIFSERFNQNTRVWPDWSSPIVSLSRLLINVLFCFFSGPAHFLLLTVGARVVRSICLERR